MKWINPVRCYISCDLFIYFFFFSPGVWWSRFVGHGAGARFLDSQAVLKRRMRAASLLFGCSSAALAVRGDQEGQGIILNYLMAGWWVIPSGTFICFVLNFNTKNHVVDISFSLLVRLCWETCGMWRTEISTVSLKPFWKPGFLLGLELLFWLIWGHPARPHTWSTSSELHLWCTGYQYNCSRSRDAEALRLLWK